MVGAVTAIAITGVKGVEASIEVSVAETAMEPSVGEAATEPSIAEEESSVAEAAVEASTGTTETSSPSDATAGVVDIERPRARVAKDLASDLKSDACMIVTPIR
jgi:hypothetical protein